MFALFPIPRVLLTPPSIRSNPGERRQRALSATVGHIHSQSESRALSSRNYRVRAGNIPSRSGIEVILCMHAHRFFGDLSEISTADLEHIDSLVMNNLVYVPMQKGDVVLVDNYQVMHGRDVFTGERLHAVTWFQ